MNPQMNHGMGYFTCLQNKEAFFQGCLKVNSCISLSGGEKDGKVCARQRHQGCLPTASSMRGEEKHVQTNRRLARRFKSKCQNIGKRDGHVWRRHENEQKCRRICWLGCVNHMCTRVRVTQPSPCIFLYFCYLLYNTDRRLK